VLALLELVAVLGVILGVALLAAVCAGYDEILASAALPY
jgi:hypothetical protein